MKRLQGAGLLRFGRRSQVIVTPFFVWKKSGQLRVIFDCRPSNVRFKAPPNVRLGTASEWGSLHLASEDNLYIASGDIKDYFYACGIDQHLSEYFSLLKISRDEFVSVLGNGDDVVLMRKGSSTLSLKSCLWAGRGRSTSLSWPIARWSKSAVLPETIIFLLWGRLLPAWGTVV